MVRVINSGIIFKSEKNTDHQSYTFPHICALPDGRWLSSSRAALKKKENQFQHIELSFSDDEGATWSSSFRPFKSLIFRGKSGLFRTAHLTPIDGNEIVAILSWVDNSEPSLPFFNEETEGLLNCEIFLSKSHNGGLSWGEPIHVDLPVFSELPTPTTGPILALSDSNLICQFEVNKTYYDSEEWHHKSVLVFSRDRGLSWTDYRIVSEDPENRIFYWDQRPGLIGDNHILILFWTYDRIRAKYLTIHARESLDGGKTWSKMWDTDVPGQPAQPVRLSDGRLVMIYVDRTEHVSIKSRLSYDDGRSWPLETEDTLFSFNSKQVRDKKSMQDAWAEMSAFSTGLPAVTKLSADEIVLVFYTGETTDSTDIIFIRLKY